MKNYLVYYQHYVSAHRHWKFKMLRSGYGWAGEGKFWALNNLIAASDNAILDLSKKPVLASAADELDFTLDEFIDFIGYLSAECELITFVDNKVTTDICRDNLHEVMKTREKAQMRRNRDLEKKFENEQEKFPKLLQKF